MSHDDGVGWKQREHELREQIRRCKQANMIQLHEIFELREQLALLTIVAVRVLAERDISTDEVLETGEL